LIYRRRLGRPGTISGTRSRRPIGDQQDRAAAGAAKHLATLPLGVAATLDVDARTLTVDEPALR
jgi:hypothetical protein